MERCRSLFIVGIALAAINTCLVTVEAQTPQAVRTWWCNADCKEGNCRVCILSTNKTPRNETLCWATQCESVDDPNAPHFKRCAYVPGANLCGELGIGYVHTMACSGCLGWVCGRPDNKNTCHACRCHERAPDWFDNWDRWPTCITAATG